MLEDITEQYGYEFNGLYFEKTMGKNVFKLKLYQDRIETHIDGTNLSYHKRHTSNVEDLDTYVMVELDYLERVYIGMEELNRINEMYGEPKWRKSICY